MLILRIAFKEPFKYLRVSQKNEPIKQTNLAKGATDPGVDCFGRFGLVVWVW